MKKQASDMSRRQLLKTLAIGSAAGVVTTISGKSVAESTAVESSETNKGYRETEHIRQFYASLRTGNHT